MFEAGGFRLKQVVADDDLDRRARQIVSSVRALATN
jgi:hypothetical protein